MQMLWSRLHFETILMNITSESCLWWMSEYPISYLLDTFEYGNTLAINLLAAYAPCWIIWIPLQCEPWTEWPGRHIVFWTHRLQSHRWGVPGETGMCICVSVNHNRCFVFIEVCQSGLPAWMGTWGDFVFRDCPLGWGSRLYSFRVVPFLSDNYTTYCLSWSGCNVIRCHCWSFLDLDQHWNVRVYPLTA